MNVNIALLPAHSNLSNGIVVELTTGAGKPGERRLVPFSYICLEKMEY